MRKQQSATLKNHFKYSLLLLASFLAMGQVSAKTLRFVALIDGGQVFTDAPATGSAVLYYDTESLTLDVTIHLFGMENDLTKLHIHAGEPETSGPHLFNLGQPSDYVMDGVFWQFTARDIPFPTEQVGNLLQGNTYLNFHTEAFPTGEVRGQILPTDSSTITVANLSTRGIVDPSNGAAGLIIGGVVLREPGTVFFRMLAESLVGQGVTTELSDPSFMVHRLAGDPTQAAEVIGGNDNWREEGQAYRILMTGLAPGFNNESATILSLDAGSYTINAHSESGAGIALVETYTITDRTIADVLNAGATADTNSEFQILSLALEATGLDAVLDGPGPFTLFAPTDSAFLDTFNQAELDELLADDADRAEDLEALTAILLSHVAGGKYLASGLAESESLVLGSLLATDLILQESTGQWTANGAPILEADIEIANGVIHVISEVLE